MLLTYKVYQGFRLDLGAKSELIIFGSLLTSFEVSHISVVKITSTLKSNHELK